MRSHGISFVITDVAQAVLEIIPDSVNAPITEVTFQNYNLLLRSSSWAFE